LENVVPVAVAAAVSWDHERLPQTGTRQCSQVPYMPKLYTDKKDKKISLYILWNSKGSGAKLYMTNELLIYGEEKKYLGISSYIKKPFLIYEYAPDPI
jgi:hypothetical protein